MAVIDVSLQTNILYFKMSDKSSIILLTEVVFHVIENSQVL